MALYSQNTNHSQTTQNLPQIDPHLSLHQPNQQQQQQQPHQLLTCPVVHLHPVNDTFIPKQIVLNLNGTKVKIGRQTSQKTSPNSTNGFFDSKVLSRLHAELWTEDGKVLIRDVKSSNGTFINGDRLSPEGVESDAFELHSEDLVEFGIDIIADDNKSIVHHKVATKVFLVLNPEDAAAAASFYRANGAEMSLRRATRAGVFGGGNFDHVLNRLQNELEKSRATGQELNTLNSAMNEINDVLGGGAGPPPPLPPPYGGRIPPFVHNSQQQQQNMIQSQLSETQASLANHIERTKTFEGVLGEHEQLKQQVSELRQQMELIKAQGLCDDLQMRQREAEADQIRGRVSPVAAMLELQEPEASRNSLSGESADDTQIDDDNASVISTDTLIWKLPLSQSALHQVNGMTSPSAAPAATSPPPSSNTHRQLESLFEEDGSLDDRIKSMSAQLEETAEKTSALAEQYQRVTEALAMMQEQLQTLAQQAEAGSSVSRSELQNTIECRLVEKIDHKLNNWKESLEKKNEAERSEVRNENEKLVEFMMDRIRVLEERIRTQAEATAQQAPGAKVCLETDDKCRKQVDPIVAVKEEDPLGCQTESMPTIESKGLSHDPSILNRPSDLDQKNSNSPNPTSQGDERQEKAANAKHAVHRPCANVAEDSMIDSMKSVAHPHKKSLLDGPYFPYFSTASGLALLSLVAYSLIDRLKG